MTDREDEQLYDAAKEAGQTPAKVIASAKPTTTAPGMDKAASYTAQIGKKATRGQKKEGKTEKNSGAQQVAKSLICGVLILVMSITVAIMSIPAMITQAIKSYVEQFRIVRLAEDFVGNMKDVINQLSYLGEMSSELFATEENGRPVVYVLTEIWDFITNAKVDDEDTDQTEEVDLGVLNSEDDYITVLQRKIKATKDRYNTRTKELYSAIINSDADNFPGKTIKKVLVNGVKRGWHEDAMKLAGNCDQIISTDNALGQIEAYSEYFDTKIGYRVHEYSYYRLGGCTFEGDRRKMTDDQALQLLALYTFQRGGDVYDPKMSGYMKWLGYSTSEATGELYFSIGSNDINHAAVGHVKAWKGEFLPQYLVEEGDDRGMLEQYTETMGCSAIDFLIKIDCPLDVTLKPEIAQSSYDKIIYKEPEIIASPVTGPQTGAPKVVQYDFGDSLVDPAPPSSGKARAKELEIDYVKRVTTYTFNYTLPLCIECRSIDEIKKVTGMYSGFYDASGEPVVGTVKGEVGVTFGGPRYINAGESIQLPGGLGSIFYFMGWQNITYEPGPQARLRRDSGYHFNQEGFAVIDDRYVVACTSTFGTIGDYVDFVQSDGTILHCVIGDFKNPQDSTCNMWGHTQGKNVVEFIVNNAGPTGQYDENGIVNWYCKNPNKPGYLLHDNPGTPSCHPEWGGKTIVSATNLGNWFDDHPSG